MEPPKEAGQQICFPPRKPGYHASDQGRVLRISLPGSAIITRPGKFPDMVRIPEWEAVGELRTNIAVSRSLAVATLMCYYLQGGGYLIPDYAFQ